MRRFDVFNGDADGICAARQLRLAEPAAAEPVTGLKHEIGLLARVDAGAGDVVTVLDLSLDRNREALLRLLAHGAKVRYFDHHHAGEVPCHPAFEAHLDATGLSCTSELVDRHLGGRFRAWAVAAAYGDNLHEAALRLAAPLALGEARLAALRTLGESINYNAYGATPADVLVAPAELYRIVSRYDDPFDLIEGEPLLARLESERAGDMARARSVSPALAMPAAHAYLFPDAAWSRRVLGSFANGQALAEPGRAVAALAPLPDGGYAVSVRAPRGCAVGAAEFCRRYPGGGGRTTAAGIECLRADGLAGFLAAFADAYGCAP